MNMPNYYGYYPQPYPSYQNNQNQQIQSGGFMVAPNEEIVQTYPVEPGKCVTFKIEGKPIIIEKSMGFSQLEPPRIERYSLHKEEMPQNEPKGDEMVNSNIDELKLKIEALENEIEGIKKKLPNNYTKKREGATDDSK